MELRLDTLDFIVFFVALFGAMLVGLLAGRKEDTSEDYFLAGRKIPWFGVAGSIFGSNVSANHMVGMMGLGFSVGFMQSHFELGAIVGLLLLCYGFLPVYRSLNIYTLSEYLGRRYDDRSRICYAVVMVILMAVVQMAPALYIGSRSACILLGGNAVEQVPAHEQRLQDSSLLVQGQETTPLDRGQKLVSDLVLPPKQIRQVNLTWYIGLIVALGVISATYTILGGLKAVVWTDVIQSVLLLVAGLGVAYLTFDAVGGWSAMLAEDARHFPHNKMHLYLPSNHATLPWTGVLTGLMFMHCFYWGTNQFIVQRALGAKSDYEARIGIIIAGFLKLLIPFFAIASGVAAYQLFSQRLPGQEIAPDTAFPEVVNLLVDKLGFGLVGLIAAGLIGAILSSVDSMMNSSATIVTFDIYKKYIRPDATDREMIAVGRAAIIGFVIFAAAVAIWVLNPNSKDNFFIQIANYSNYLTPGLLVAFLLGIFWRRGTAQAAFVTIVVGIVFSWVIQYSYDSTCGMNASLYRLVLDETELEKVELGSLPDAVKHMTANEFEVYLDEKIRPQLNVVNRFLGPTLNFFHRVMGVIGLCCLVFVCVSLCGRPDPEKSRNTWTDLGGYPASRLKRRLVTVLLSLTIYVVAAVLMIYAVLTPLVSAWFTAVWTFAMFALTVVFEKEKGTRTNWKDDRLLAGLLAALAIFMMFCYYNVLPA